MNITAMGTNKAYYFNNLDLKDIAQSIEMGLAKDTDLPFINNVEAINGIKQFITAGLLNKTNFKKGITIDDWNPKLPIIFDTFIKSDYRWVLGILIPETNILIEALNSDKNKNLFKKSLINLLYTSLKTHIFNLWMLSIFKEQILKPDLITKEQDINLDIEKTITFGTEAEIITGLETIRGDLLSFGTPSYQHTIWSKKTKSNNFYASFNMNDFIILWNSKFYNALGKVKANAFNKTDILINGPKIKVLDFAKITDATASDLKTVAYLIHKNSLIQITPGDKVLIQQTTPNFQTLYKTLFIFGFGRLPMYPIAKYKVA